MVTSVGLDHTDWLGDTREKVAVEKLGIGRAGRPLVYGEENAPANLDAELDRLKAVPLRAGREFQVEAARLSIRDGQRQRHYPLPLPPLARTTWHRLPGAGRRVPPADDAPHQAADTGLVGRCWCYRGVQCVLDVGRNLEALTLRGRLPACRPPPLVGMMTDKPVEAVVALFADWMTGIWRGRRSAARRFDGWRARGPSHALIAWRRRWIG